MRSHERENRIESASQAANGSTLALRFTLASGVFAMPLDRLHHLAGFATLTGEPEDYFLGWLMLRGDWIPVFDLNRIVCDQPTPEAFGSRILVVKAGAFSPTPYLGLLAAAITDTILTKDAEVFDLNMYLPMLYTLIPFSPADV